ncbi:MAG: BatA domain-containing protein [Planctomycetota bacterium]
MAGLWTTPALAGAGAGLIAVPIIIHLLFRIRRKRMEWGAMRFLLEAFKKQRRRLQVERWLLLVVRCLVVLILGLALAGPMLGGAGGWLGGLVGGGVGGRVVHVVVDDGLSSGMAEVGGVTRLERLKGQARGLVNGLDAGDRVVVWRAGVPVEKLAGEALDEDGLPTGMTPGEALAVIEGLAPRFGGSGVDDALVGVSEALEGAGGLGRVEPGRAVVAVFSDFARGAGYLGEPVPTELEGLGRRANLALSAATGAAANVQVAGVRPRRRLVVVEPGLSATVSGSVGLRRFGGVAEAAAVRLRVELRAVDGGQGAGAGEAAQNPSAFAGLGDGQVLAELERVVRLAAGQASIVENVDLVLPDGALEFDAGGEEGAAGDGGRWLAMVAEVEALDGASGAGGVGLDGLRVDDAAYGVVELRQRLRVGVVEDVSVSAGDAGLRAGQWLEAALAPGLGVDGFEVSVLAPTALSEEAMSRLDVLMVVRPDLLSSPAWEGVGRYAADGGLVWVWMPSQYGAEQETDWGFLAVMRQQLGLGMGFGGVLEAEQDGGRRLDEGVAAPEALSLVAAVWGDLIRPVRVERWLPIEVGEGGGEVWLRLAGMGDDAGLLVLEPKGDGGGVGGAVLVCGLALDPAWSNLVTRPLLVPLLQDGVRGVLGGSVGSPQNPSASVGLGDGVVSGQGVALDRAVYGTGVAVERKAAAGVHGLDGEVVVEPRDGDAGLEAVLVEPGVYGAGEGAGSSGSAQGLLAVNVEAGAGDTGAADVEQLGAWLGALGPSLTVDAEAPAGVLSAGLAPRDFGWELLWVLLGLVVLEMFLARRFSHASSSEGASVARRVLGHLRGNRVTHSGLGGGRRGRAA